MVPVAERPWGAPTLKRGLFNRPEFDKAMLEQRDKRLTLISAPLGYGKTTALALWAKRAVDAGRCVVWLTLHARDNDIDVLADDLLEAFSAYEQANVPMQRAVGENDSLQYVIDAMAKVPDDAILIVDGFESLTDENAQNQFMRLIESMSYKQRLILSSAGPFNLNTAQLRLSGDVLDVGIKCLRVTMQEARDALSPVGVHDDLISYIVSETDGCVACLNMVKEQIPATFVHLSQHHQTKIIEQMVGVAGAYYKDAVMAHCPAHLESFVYETAAITLFSSAICGKSSEDMSFHDTVSELRLCGLPVFDEESAVIPHSLRYHRTFGKALQTAIGAQRRDRELRRALLEAHAAGAHKAVLYYAAQITAELDDVIAAVVNAMSACLSDVESFPYVAAIGSKMDARLLADNPRAFTSTAMAMHYIGDYQGITRVLDLTAVAASRIDTANRQGCEPSIDDCLRAVAAVVDCENGVNEQAIEVLSELEKVFEGLPEFRSWIILETGCALRAVGNIERARDMFRNGASMVLACGRPAIWVSFCCEEAICLKKQGKLNLAVHLLQNVTSRAAIRPDDMNPETSLILRSTLAEMHIERDETDQAGDELSEAVEAFHLGLLSSMISKRYYSYVLSCLARYFLAIGDNDSASESFLALSGIEKLGVGNEWFRADLGIRLWAVCGGRDLGEQVWDVDGLYPELEIASTAAEAKRALIARDLPEANYHISTLTRLLEGSEWHEWAMTLDFLSAIYFEIQGDYNTANQIAHNLFACAEADGHLRMFADNGSSLGRICLSLVDRLLNIENDSATLPSKRFLRKLFRMQRGCLRVEKARDPITHFASGKLTKREQEILTQLAGDMPLQEMADSLFISKNTLKTHIRHIYEKLGVSSRRDAIRKIAEWGIELSE